MNDWEETTNHFSSPENLLLYLENNIPQTEELAFTHGDFCLPNIFAVQGKATGFIDVGRAGVADIWQDIAPCIRSLWHNFNTKKYDELFLKEINTPLNKEKFKRGAGDLP